jgi:ATP-binding protein involved in chromosome partitioning
VGKSVITSVGSLLLARKNLKVGLLDLDLHGPSAHTILGARSFKITENRGILPHPVAGVHLMSIAPFIGQRPSLLRGADISNAMLELLSVTKWGKLNFLMIDLPPGTGEEVIDLTRLIQRAEFILISTPSKISTETVERLGLALKSLGASILGVVENMRFSGSQTTKNLAKKLKTKFLGSIRFDRGLETAVGSPKKLLKTTFAQDLKKILEQIQ